MVINALIDTPTSALLTLHTNLTMIAFLAKSIPDSEEVINVTFPNYPRGIDIKPDAYPENVWDKFNRLFGVGTPDERLRRHALLAAKKAEAFAEISRTLAFMRGMMMSSVPLQEMVYIAKRLEAERYKREANSKEDVSPIDYPYVTQYADLAGLSIGQAANEILLKARLFDDALFKSEYFRLKYFGLLRETQSVGAIDAYLIGFRREFFGEKVAS